MVAAATPLLPSLPVSRRPPTPEVRSDATACDVSSTAGALRAGARIVDAGRRRSPEDTMSVEEVERAMRGDHDAFAALVNASANRIFALASLILRDSDRAQDATQEAIVRAWRELPRLRDPERFEAWLRRMVVNACYDEGRKTRRRAEVSLVNLADHQTIDPTTRFAESERIDRAFRRLPLEQRTVLVLQHQFGMSHVEIAETLGVPVGTVKSRIRYGTVAMRAALEADDRVAAQAAGRTA